MAISDEDWRAVWAEEPEPATRDRVIGAACAELDSLAEQQPGAFREIDRVIREALERGIDVETWDPVDRFLSLYVHPDVKYLFVWTLMNADERLPIVETFASSAAGAALRLLVATNAPKIEDAYKVWRETPENWRNLGREIFDVLGEGLRIRIRITNFNGERFTVESSPSSLIGLASYLLDTLTLVEYSAADDYARQELEGVLAKVTDWMKAEETAAAGAS